MWIVRLVIIPLLHWPQLWMHFNRSWRLLCNMQGSLLSMQSLFRKCLSLSGCQFVTCLPIFSHPWLHIFDGLKKAGIVSTNWIATAESAESPDLFCILGTKAFPPTVSLLQLQLYRTAQHRECKICWKKQEVLICSVGNVAICLSITMADAVADPSLNPIFRWLLYFQMF